MIPTATYRLQFREGMTFARAAALAPYLARLGVSHLYASPLFAAASGSTHGYDGTDFSAMEPTIGGEEGFAAFSQALQENGLKLLLDFVPNHMAAAESNPWWRLVLEWGNRSPHAGHFDIDWTADRLLLPILGTPYGEALEGDLFSVRFDASTGALFFTVYDRELPLLPATYPMVLSGLHHENLAKLAEAFVDCDPAGSAAAKAQLVEAAREPEAVQAIDRRLGELSHEDLHALHEAQAWRLAHWPLGREALSYRRFFEITDLICTRVEDEAVFDEVHARLKSLVSNGEVDAVRIDHIDGLADPRGYLDTLQATLAQDGGCYVLVEKILEGDEELRPDWSTAGTTGYEFIAALAGLFVDPASEPSMTEAYRRVTGDETDYSTQARDCKRMIVERNLATDLAVLVRRALGLSDRDLTTRDLGADTLRQGIVEIIAALPVYRTYVDAEGASENDARLIADAVLAAREGRRVDNPAGLDFLQRLLLLEGAWLDDADARAFVTRFQQVSGPAMAKAIEDTLFYRFNRLIALNEVGGDPAHYGASADEFHAAMQARLQSQPAGLSATSTHDTKRGEDARARLYVLSEMANEWAAAVERWMTPDFAGSEPPDAATQWLFLQALVGAWPAEFTDLPLTDGAAGALEDLRERMRAYMQKALREAKLHTSWTDQDEAFESRVDAYVQRMLDWNTGKAFLQDFAATCRPVGRAGATNSLSQLALKLTAPGVPDIYQGCELWDFSLVDPDNRRAVDFDVRTRLLDWLGSSSPETLCSDWRSGALKLALLHAGLALRNELPQLFASGEYLPLPITGPAADRALAFARRQGQDLVIVIVPRLVSDLLEDDSPLIPAGSWGDTRVDLDTLGTMPPLTDIVTGVPHDVAGGIALRDALARFPVAILRS